MVTKESNNGIDNYSNDMDKDKDEKGQFDSETVNGSPSSQNNVPSRVNRKMESTSRVTNKPSKNGQAEVRSRSSRERTDKSLVHKKQAKGSLNTPKKSAKSNGGISNEAKNTPGRKSQNIKVHPKPSSESSEGFDERLIDEVKELGLLEKVPNGSQNIGSDNESVDADENDLDEDQDLVEQKIQEMELKIKKLEDELREIAALEISLYSVLPEHGSSSHKVHTPARRLSRLYIHASKHWTQDKRGSIARNTASGLVLVAKSCGNDIPRLTFWLSNTVVLREILSQAFTNSLHSSLITRMVEPDGVVNRSSEEKSSSFRKNGTMVGKQVNIGFTQFADDWQETRTFTSALEKIESWIFSRIVESVWWQILTPHMQSPVEDAYTSKSNGRLLGPSLGDQKQGSFSVNLWRSAFQDAFQKLCPVRAVGHECGCLPVLARMVMEQCVARLDVAMFNAILRESVHDIPTDPVSDPIVDSKVLPIPAGDLSFGSGAQLKNSVGNWSRWLTDLFGMDIDESLEDELNSEEHGTHDTDVRPKSFPMLNELSDLLMLPKDMLMDQSIRKEVCPSIGLSLIKRVLCNFTPDEFCPDSVPGAVLEALNAESGERRLARGESTNSFPCSAAPVVYIPPPATPVAEKAGTTETIYQLERNVSNIQRKGYTSDEELDELDSPLTSIVDKSPVFTSNGNGDLKEKACCNKATIRYELLRDVWSI